MTKRKLEGMLGKLIRKTTCYLLNRSDYI